MTAKPDHWNDPSHPYDPKELSEAVLLSLGRTPSTPSAELLVRRVSDIIRPLLGERSHAALRGLRDKGRKRRESEVGIILGGLMPLVAKRRWAVVHEGTGAWFWNKKRSLPFGHRAFWRKAQALHECGLVEHVGGCRFKDATGFHRGLAARLRASDKLIELARECGCHVDKRAWEDWPLVQPADLAFEAPPLVELAHYPTKKNGAIFKSTEPPLPIPVALKDVESLVKRLTEALDAKEVAGCTRPVLTAKFIGSPHLHGRLYARGAESYQSGISKPERSRIMIGGEPVVEIDLQASFLSIALSLLGVTQTEEEDPYSLPGLPEDLRPAIKQWFVVFFSSGSAPRKWPKRTGTAIRDMVAVTRITEAAFQRYPALHRIADVLPPALVQDVPKSLRTWAIGQYLTGIEAALMRDVLATILDSGGVALPIHDALIVPRSGVEQANAAFKAACDRKGFTGLRWSVSDSRADDYEAVEEFDDEHEEALELA